MNLTFQRLEEMSFSFLRGYLDAYQSLNGFHILPVSSAHKALKSFRKNIARAEYGDWVVEKTTYRMKIGCESIKNAAAQINNWPGQPIAWPEDFLCGPCRVYWMASFKKYIRTERTDGLQPPCVWKYIYQPALLGWSYVQHYTYTWNGAVALWGAPRPIYAESK